MMADLIRGSGIMMWEQFMLVTGALSGAKGFEDIREALGLTALGSSLWDRGRRRPSMAMHWAAIL